jgi:hypothetical protein
MGGWVELGNGMVWSGSPLDFFCTRYLRHGGRDG